MPRSLTRREFLGAAIVSGAGLAATEAAAALARGVIFQKTAEWGLTQLGHYSPDWGIFLESEHPDEYVSYNEAADLAVRFDDLYDRLPRYQPPVSNELLLLWAMEVIPQIVLEGAADAAILPKELKLQPFFWQEFVDKHAGALGMSDCETFAISNLRLANPLSSWYRNVSIFFSSAHEMVHLHQGSKICGTPTAPTTNEERDWVETSAQLVTLEVMAALANAGNIYALYALVHEMRGTAIAAARYAAHRDGKNEEFEQLRARISPGAFSQAAYEQGKRNLGEEGILRIVERYDLRTLGILMMSAPPNGTFYGLALPPTTHTETDDLGNPLFGEGEPRYFNFDDFLYIIGGNHLFSNNGRLETMVEEARQKIENGEIELLK